MSATPSFSAAHIVPEASLTLGSPIGRGSFGVVYRGTTAGLPVCAKALHVLTDPMLYGTSEDSTAIDRFIREFLAEASMLATLHHDRVLSFRGVVMDAVSLQPKFLLFELADDSFRGFLNKLDRRITVSELYWFAIDILDALAYLHSLNIVHRDLKLENILVFTRRGGFVVLKVGDVGLARFLAGGGRSTLSAAGTPLYTAPEVFSLSQRYDTKADMFSFAVMMAEIVIGYVMQDKPDAPLQRDQLVGIVCKACTFLETESPDGFTLAEVIRSCFSESAVLRPTAVAALASLRSAVSDAGLTHTHNFPISNNVAHGAVTTELNTPDLTNASFSSVSTTLSNECRGGSEGCHASAGQAIALTPVLVSTPVSLTPDVAPPGTGGSGKQLDPIAVLDAVRSLELESHEDAVALQLLPYVLVPEAELVRLLTAGGVPAAKVLRARRQLSTADAADVPDHSTVTHDPVEVLDELHAMQLQAFENDVAELLLELAVVPNADIAKLFTRARIPPSKSLRFQRHMLKKVTAPAPAPAAAPALATAVPAPAPVSFGGTFTPVAAVRPQLASSLLNNSLTETTTNAAPTKTSGPVQVPSYAPRGGAGGAAVATAVVPAPTRDNGFDHLVKVLFLGDSGVGKTSLLVRISDNTFDQSYMSTIGIDFKHVTRVHSGKRYKMQLWDTAGQERFRTITQSYMRGAHAAFVVFDVTERSTFTNAKHWLDQLRQENIGARVLFGNKQDMARERQVSEVEAEEYAASLGVRYIDGSAKTGDKVNEAIDVLLALVAPTLPSPALMARGLTGAREAAAVRLNDGARTVGCSC